MKAVELIDKKIAELRAVRREVVKGERRFSKELEMDKAEEFKTMLDKYNIPYEEFEFGCGLFIKVKDLVSEEVTEVEEDLGDVSGQTFDPNC